MVVVGSSLVVYPAAHIPSAAVDHGRDPDRGQRRPTPLTGSRVLSSAGARVKCCLSWRRGHQPLRTVTLPTLIGVPSTTRLPASSMSWAVPSNDAIGELPRTLLTDGVGKLAPAGDDSSAGADAQCSPPRAAAPAAHPRLVELGSFSAPR